MAVVLEDQQALLVNFSLEQFLWQLDDGLQVHLVGQPRHEVRAKLAGNHAVWNQQKGIAIRRQVLDDLLGQQHMGV